MTADFRLDRASVRRLAQPSAVLVLPGEHVLLRRPRLGDGPAWRATSLRDADRLAPGFGSAGVAWDDAVSLTAWTERHARQRRLARAGMLVPYVAAHTDGRVAGEVSFAIDPRTAVAEASIWLARDLSVTARTWFVSSALQRLFELPQPIRRVTAPVAVGNPGPARLLEALGFERRATALSLRPYDGAWTDHDVWWLEHDSATPATLAASVSTGPPTGTRPIRPLPSPALLLPVARAAARRARSRRDAHRSDVTVHASGGSIVLPFGRTGAVRVDDRDVGLGDVRLDPGTSSVEAWTRLSDPAASAAIIAALSAHAATAGARRVSWSVGSDSAEAVAAHAAGWSCEGSAHEPHWLADVPHQQWATVLAA